MYIRSMHNRVGPRVESFDLTLRATALVLVPLVLAILAFALYPQLALDSGEEARGQGDACQAVARRDDEALAVRPPSKGPHIDWAALSPLIALTAGACIVLLVGLARSPFIRTQVVPVLTLVTLGATAGPRRSGSGTTTTRSSRARCGSTT